MAKAGWLTEMAKAIDEVDPEPISMPGEGVKPLTPNMLEIVRILQDNLLLCEPCLIWVRQKQAEIAMAQLRALYTEEELQTKLEGVKK